MPADALTRTRNRMTLLVRSARLMGVRATLRRGAELLLRDRSENDRAFDRRHATDTSGRVPPAALGIADPLARAQAVLYLPSPARVTRQLLDALDVDVATWSFVDFGSGKGRVVLVAAERPFRTLLGVELSPALHATAIANLARYTRGSARLAQVRFCCEDARTVALPEGDTVFHFYHPFQAVVLRAVLRRIEASLAAAPRRIRIVYLGAFPEAMLVFAEFRFLRQLRFSSCIDPKFTWSMFGNTHAS